MPPINAGNESINSITPVPPTTPGIQVNNLNAFLSGNANEPNIAKMTSVNPIVQTGKPKSIAGVNWLGWVTFAVRLICGVDRGERMERSRIIPITIPIPIAIGLIFKCFNLRFLKYFSVKNQIMSANPATINRLVAQNPTVEPSHRAIVSSRNINPIIARNLVETRILRNATIEINAIPAIALLATYNTCVQINSCYKSCCSFRHSEHPVLR